MTKPLFEQLQDSRLDGISPTSVAERFAYAEALEQRLRAAMATGLPSTQFALWQAAAEAAHAARTILLEHPGLQQAGQTENPTENNA